jgi:hypothetical protein
MFVSDADDSLVEQGNLSKVVVEYKGLLATKNGYGETDTEAQMLSLIGSNSNTDGDGAGASATYLIPVPKPIFTWTYVVTTDPGQGGVGLPSGATFLPSPASWDITVAQGQSLTYNYYTGWVLESRRKKTVYGAPVYEVVEKYAYYYPIG